MFSDLSAMAEASKAAQFRKAIADALALDKVGLTVGDDLKASLAKSLASMDGVPTLQGLRTSIESQLNNVEGFTKTKGAAIAKSLKEAFTSSDTATFASY